jgi:hypothetical protein
MPRRFRRGPRLVAVAATALAVVAVAVVGSHAASAAAAGCSVNYAVSSQWPGGFGANVTVTNLGDPIVSWRLTWSFTAGQTVTQLWNGTYTQSGAQVSVDNAPWNGAIATGSSTQFGFNGAMTGGNPVPSSFSLNGVACTGGITPSSPPPSSPSSPPPGNGPCDVYAAGGTPCVAAHSTTRALFGSYRGPLYQVRRASDNTTRDVGVLAAGGVADASIQDSFCSGTGCVITIIYDQTSRHNNLTQAPPGGFAGPAAGGYDNLANATAAPVTVGGHKAYGVFVAPGTGYRNNNTSGVATGDQPEGMYAIFDGTHYNGGCCFDYGNAERNSRDNGNGTMEAIYFGNIKVWGYGTGNGPWIMADLENGLYSGVNAGYNANDPSIGNRFVTAIVKGEPNHWAIRGGNAQSGGLSTFYNGARPNVAGYNPMKKEGAIILGIGGDNSIGAAGTFYEGVMTSGYPSDATENAVQATITAAGYR